VETVRIDVIEEDDGLTTVSIPPLALGLDEELESTIVCPFSDEVRLSNSRFSPKPDSSDIFDVSVGRICKSVHV